MPEEVAYKEGAVLYFENDVSGEIFIIRSGTVELTREVVGVLPRHANAGEIIGLSDSLGGGRRIESARAATNVSATRVSVEDLKGMLSNNVAIGLKVITSLCAELREIDEFIVRRMRGGIAQSFGHGVGLRMIADHFRRKGASRAARYAYGRYLECGPTGEDFLEGALNLANLCEKDGEIEAAMGLYEVHVRDYPDEPRAQSAYHRLKSVMETLGGKL
jgi:CRP-like cAMP-binding protein